MRVALCFYGQPRFINNPYTWLSHKLFIIDRYKTDIYAHTWISNKSVSLNYSDWVYERGIQIIDQVEADNSSNIILKKYPMVNYIFEEPREFHLLEESKNAVVAKEAERLKNPNQISYYSLNNENNILSQLYSISKVIQLIKNKDYDWVVLSRYDNYITNFPSLYNLDNNFLYLDDRFLCNFSDPIMIGGQKNIEALDSFDKVNEYAKEINIFTPEEFKRVAYSKYSTNVKRIPIGFGIVRSDKLDKVQY